MSKIDHDANPKSSSRAPRSHHVANLKSSLTALVIYHHTAICYGGLGSGPFKSSLVQPASSTALVGFNVLNQSFFMASFMYISGHYAAKALERKSTMSFAKDRLYRLGLPTVAYSLFIHPICYAVIAAAEGRRYGVEHLKTYWSGIRGPKGPVWFTGTLLAFDLGLACYRYLTRNTKLDARPEEQARIARPEKAPSYKILTGLAAFTAIDFLVRTVYPLESPDAYFAPLGVKLGYLPQYVAAYIFGANSQSILDAVPSSEERFVILHVFFVASTIIAQRGKGFRDAQVLERMGGGWNWLAVGYSVWNNFTGYLVGSGLLKLFSECLNSPWGKFNELAYTAFLIHMPISTALEVVAEQWHAPQLVKFGAIGTGITALSWAGAWILQLALNRR